ncbi:MAG: urease accessory protein UreD [Acidobacteriota bacterium]
MTGATTDLTGRLTADAAGRRDSRAASEIGRVARLELVFSYRRGRTVLAHAYAEPPFRVGRLLEAGPVAQAILVCSGPGIFTGDRLTQRVRVESGARLLLVSQAALQLHPSAAAVPASLEACYEVEDDATLDCFWDPVIPFAGVRVRQRIDLRIAGGGEIFWSDALMSGRVGRGERWQFAALAHELRAHVGGALAYLERYDLSPSTRSATHPWRAHRANYLGTTIVRSPAATAGRAESAQRRLGAIAGLQAGVDCLEPDLIVGRLMAEQGPPFLAGREVLRSVFERPPLRR